MMSNDIKKTKNKKQKRNILFNYHFSNQSFQILLLVQMVSKNQGRVKNLSKKAK